MGKGTAEKIRRRISKLRDEVDQLRYRYHVQNDPQVTDEIYTSLRHELAQWEGKYPQFKSADSPTARIAGKSLAKFKKITHLIRQWSLDDAFDEEELNDWENKNKRILKKKGKLFQPLDYLAEVKIDGLHIILTYRRGILKSGATRGDGIVGEDVTQNIKTIESVQLVLKEKVDLVAEGECWLSKQELGRINRQREKKGEALFANARNAAAGSIRQLNPAVAASRRLDSFIYQIHPIPGGHFPFPIKTQIEKLKVLEKLGFKVNPLYRHAKDLAEIAVFFQKFGKKRDNLPYGVDGLVIKANWLKYQKELGFTGKSPRWGVALKFPAETTTTQIKDIQVQVGRTGALTPIAVLWPVPIAGSVVSRATLHNEEEIKRLDVKIGDTVAIRKAGDVIPEIVEVIKNLRNGKEKVFLMPRECPICGSKVEKRYLKEGKAEAALYCSNKKCFAQKREKLVHFAGKIGFNIEGLGDKIIFQLLEKGLISDFSDIFRLKETDLIPLERFAELSAKNLVRAIQKSKSVKIEKFVTALGIRYIGEETAILVARCLTDGGLRTVRKELAPIEIIKRAGQLSLEEWREAKGIGEKAAGSLLRFFQERKNRQEFERLTKFGVKILVSPARKIGGGKLLERKTFVFTGALPTLGRDEAKELARAAGGEISSTVSKKTDYVVAGDNPGSKLAKAKGWGVKIIDEQEFRKLIQ